MKNKERKTEMEVRKIVTPGQEISTRNKRMGGNVFVERGSVYSERMGLVEVNEKRVEVIPLSSVYIPSQGDVIVGVVQDVTPTSWVVNIFSPYTAYLPVSRAFPNLRESEKLELDEKIRVGEVLVAQVEIAGYGINPILTLIGKRLGRKRKGRLIFVNPAKVPRIIGKKGSMINMLMKETGCEVIVGKNGVIIVNCEDEEKEALIHEIIRKIERESHTKGLTNRVEKLLDEKLRKWRK